MKVTNQGVNYNHNQNSNAPGNLNQDDFLKILVAQMRYQDPLSPTNDKEFISQMAQFSALEQMVNLNNKFSSMSYLLALGFDSMNAFSLIGKEVEVQLSSDETLIGTVDRVLQKDGEFFIEINKELYTLAQIKSVSREGASQPGGDETNEDNQSADS